MTRDTELNCRITGAMSPEGEKLIAFKQRRQTWYINFEAFVLDPATSVRDLAQQGLWAGGQTHIAKMLEAIRGIERFAPVDVLNAPGWNGPSFARSDGKVFVPSQAKVLGEAPSIGFFRHPVRNRPDGTLAAWKEEIAHALLSDDVATMIASAALAPIVRSLLSQAVPPFGLQIVTEHDRPLFRSIAESMIGSTDPSFLCGDPIQRFVSKPERYIAASRDHILLIDDVEAYLCGSVDKKRKAAVRSIVFDQLLPSGTRENSSNGQAAPMFLLLEARPIATTLDLDDVAAGRLGRFLLTFDLTKGTDQYRSRQSAWIKAVNATGCRYGTPLRAFQKRIVGRREEIGLTRLQAELDKDFQQFGAQAGRVFSPEQLPNHLLHPFSLLYAAFRMAERLNVLPTGGGTPPAIWTVFKQFMTEQPQPVTAASTLMAVASRSGVLIVSEIQAGMTKEQIEQVPAFIKQLNNGRVELWVSTKQKKEVFNWPVFRKLPDFRKWYRGNGEKGHNGAKRVIGGRSLRVVRFLLPS